MRVGFLTEEEAGSLVIQRMILHVVGKGGFVAQPEMAVEQAPFFLDRIKNAAIDGVHIFNKNSATKQLVEAIAAGPDTFENCGQRLARAFSQYHVGASTDGAFFVFQLGTHDPITQLFSLIKYDYRVVLELVNHTGTQHLREVVQAFVREPRAIQKSCMVRIRNGVADELVSAFDRMGRTPDLTDYFGRFLDVARERSDDELSKSLNEALRATLSAVQEYLPHRDVVAALDVGKESLRGRITVDETAIREAVFVAAGSPDDEVVRKVLDIAIDKQLGQRRLRGVEFRPNPEVLAKRPKRKIRTVEGVMVVFPGDEEGQSVRISSDDGGRVITIRTKAELVEDGTLAEGSR